MNVMTMQSLEYEKIKGHVREYAMSFIGRQHVDDMQPLTDVVTIRTLLDEAEEAQRILATGGSVPIPSLGGMEHLLELLGTGYLFHEEDFGHLYTFLRSIGQLRKYMASKRDIAPKVSSFAQSMYDLNGLQQEIDRCIRNGRITDYASKELNKIRKKLMVIEERLKQKVQSLMTRYSNWLQEPIVSMRGDRYVLPIKKEHRKRINGQVLDESGSGQTVYIVPHDIAQIQLELSALRAEEAKEEAKILGMLTGLVEEKSSELKANVEIVGVYDFLFAKAKYAQTINGCNVQLNDKGRIVIQGARHPLLGSEMVPLDFAIGDGYRCLIITGPNTGGKTVALKTVGLLTLMVQSGIPVPVKPGSTFSIFEHIAADIGDGQSLEQSLSTFSAHVRNMVDILQMANRSTLVFIDEMASGTDPGEGVGLSIAILEELALRGAIVVVTTHYNEIKHFASETPGFENARMEFDADTLQPKYVLKIGEAGYSYAFQIARNLGIPEEIIRRSEEWLKRQNTQQPELSPTSDKWADQTKLTNVGESGADESARSANMVSTVTAKSLEFVGRRGNPQQEEESTNWMEDGEVIQAEDSMEQQVGEGVVSQTNKATKHLPDDNASHLNEDDEVRKAKGKQPAKCDNAELVDSKAKKRIEVGDRVYISYLKRTGVVYREEDAKGNVGVIVQNQKMKINQKRLSLHIPKSELYPDDYDFDIIFESKEDRKKRNLMKRKHVEGLIIEKRPEDD